MGFMLHVHHYALSTLPVHLCQLCPCEGAPRLAQLPASHLGQSPLVHPGLAGAQPIECSRPKGPRQTWQKTDILEKSRYVKTPHLELWKVGAIVCTQLASVPDQPLLSTLYGGALSRLKVICSFFLGTAPQPRTVYGSF